MTRFTLPRDIYHGKGALAALKDFQGKKAAPSGPAFYLQYIL